MFTFVAYIVTILSLAVAALYVYLRNALLFWKKQGVNTTEKQHILFGDFADLVTMKTAVGERYKELYFAFGDEHYGGIHFFWRPVLLLKDLDLIKQVLVKDFSNFHSRGLYYDMEKYPLSGNLFFLGGPKWRRMRVKLTPTFTTGKVKMMLETLLNCTNQLNSFLEKEVKKNDVIDIKEVLARLGTDIVASVAFGIQCNSINNPDEEFRSVGKKIFDPTLMLSIRNMSYFFVHSFIKWFNIDVTDPSVTKFMKNVVNDTVNYREINGVSRPDFLNLLIEMKNAKPAEDTNGQPNGTALEKDTQPITMNEIAAQAFVFFAAGYETTSTTTGFCLYELARHQGIQTAVRREIDEALKQTDGKITYELLANSLPYTDKVVSETLRLYPPVPFLTREAANNFELNGRSGKPLKIAKGQQIAVSISGIHMDPKYYPDPEVFDPERFSPENIATRHRFSYIPFGEGPRICIGMRFGLIQVKLSLVNILSHYKVETCSRTPKSIKLDPKSFILFQEGGLYLRLVPLHD